MKKLMKVETNASTMFVTYDEGTKIAMVLDNEETNAENADIRTVEDDSSWELYEDIEDIKDFLGCNTDCDASEIVDEIEIYF